MLENFHKSGNYIRHTFTAMGGPCELLLELNPEVFGKNELRAEQENNEYSIMLACEAEVARLEKKYSRYRSDSFLTQINLSHDNPIELDSETAGLLNYANTAYQESDGLFDITSGVLRNLWDFEKSILPSEQRLSQILKHIGWDKVFFDGRLISVPENMEIDLGGVVKEYAADSLVSIAERLGCKSGYVNLGGDISVVGPRTVNGEELPWYFGVRDPEQPERAKATIEISRGALASSGDYERFFIKEGARYCHILNPKTGMPSQGVGGVSVHAPNCLIAGTMSTVAMLLGPERGRQWLQQNQIEFVLFER